MAFVGLMWLTVATFLFAQGVHIIRTGQVTLFLAKPEHRPPARSALVRSAAAFLYLAASVGLTAILARKIEQVGLGPLRAWLHSIFGMLLWSFVLAAIGILHLLQPAKMLRWTIRFNPGLADNRSVVITTRLIGLGVLCVAFAIMARL